MGHREGLLGDHSGSSSCRHPIWFLMLPSAGGQVETITQLSSFLRPQNTEDNDLEGGALQLLNTGLHGLSGLLGVLGITDTDCPLATPNSCKLKSKVAVPWV